MWWRIGVRTNLANMAGRAAPCPEPKGLKAPPPVAQAGFQLPAAGRSGNGSEKPKLSNQDDKRGNDAGHAGSLAAR